MNNNTDREPTAAEAVADIAEGQIESIRLLLCPEEDDVVVTLTDEGATLGIDGNVVEVEVDADSLEAYKDEDGEVDKDDLISDNWDELNEHARERYHEHGLAFDYNDNREEHYFCYLISTGGPGTEIRFFANPDLSLYRAEFWYLPWFDGASVTVTSDPTVQALWDDFNECGTCAYLRDKALNDE